MLRGRETVSITGLLAMGSRWVERVCVGEHEGSDTVATSCWTDLTCQKHVNLPNSGALSKSCSFEASRSFVALAPVIPVPPPSREVRLIYSCIMLRDSWSAPKTRWTSVGPLVRRPVALSHHTSRVASASGRPNHGERACLIHLVDGTETRHGRLRQCEHPV